MNYKGYMGHVVYDDVAKIFHGEVVNTRTVITFQGTSVEEIESEFKNSVDDYLEWCAKRNKDPERPYSGKFNLRIPPELHREIAIVSRKQNTSLNKFVEKALRDELALSRKTG